MEEDGDWDLQAVVRGCMGGPTAAAAAAASASAPADSLLFSTFGSSSPFTLLGEDMGQEEDDLLFCFPDLLATETVLHELDELWKPFFPSSSYQQQQQQQQQEQEQQQQQQMLLLSPQRSPSYSAPPLLVSRVAQPPLQQQVRSPPRKQQRPLSQLPRSKRRKNQQKKVVCHVPADGLSADMWAWRKYGQKPIKGSPYPRGYYRCSSSKGCPARKQVERSRTDPGIFVITYTAEHNHPIPTHRNSLAGSTRHKFPPSTTTAAAGGGPPINAPAGGDPPVNASSSSPLSSSTAAGLSPTTPLTTSMEEEENEEEEDLLTVGDMEMLGEDDVLFMGLEEMRDPTATSTADDGFADHFGAFSPPWMTSSAATAASGS